MSLPFFLRCSVGACSVVQSSSTALTMPGGRRLLGLRCHLCHGGIRWQHRLRRGWRAVCGVSSGWELWRLERCAVPERVQVHVWNDGAGREMFEVPQFTSREHDLIKIGRTVAKSRDIKSQSPSRHGMMAWCDCPARDWTNPSL